MLLLNRSWSVYGEFWRSQELGHITAAIAIYDVSKIKSGIDCFRPSVFDSVILHDLYYHFGPGATLGKHCCPVNWHVKTINDTKWIYTEAWQKDADIKQNPYYQSYFYIKLYTPISETKFVLLQFRVFGYLPYQCSNVVMRNFIESLLPSISLTLDSYSCHNKEVKNTDESYSSYRKEEPWIYHISRQGDFTKGEPDYIIEKHGTAPPKKFNELFYMEMEML